MTSPREIGQSSASVPIGPSTQPRRSRSPWRMKISTSLVSQSLAAVSQMAASTGCSGGRARDDPQNVAGRGLVLKRLLELAFACLLSLEQSRILDRDNGLVCERLDELYLMIAEWFDANAE